MALEADVILAHICGTLGLSRHTIELSMVLRLSENFYDKTEWVVDALSGNVGPHYGFRMSRRRCNGACTLTVSP